MTTTELARPEAENTNSENHPALLDTLAAADFSLAERINSIQAGMSPNGHNPNGLVTAALEGGPEDRIRYVGEYRWAVMLAAHPYLEREEKTDLLRVGVYGLFKAGESYNPAPRVNFLRHTSKVIGSYLMKSFGEIETTDLPPAHKFEDFVIGDWAPEELRRIGRPALPPARVEHASQPVQALMGMTSERRIAAYHAGELTHRQLSAWSGRFPEEVPLINGEFEWIARSLADFDD